MQYDLVIIGAGPAGFSAALTAKRLGLKTCLIERARIGGTCLNQGCIPTKALIQSAKVYTLTKKSAIFGLDPLVPQLNFIKAQERKDKIVQGLGKGMESMLKGIDFLNLPASIVSSNEVKVGEQGIKAKYILIASGSKPAELKTIKFDHTKIISSDDLLEIKRIPKSLLIIGGGVIGCEFASLFFALGTDVTIVEKMPQLLPQEDKEVARKIEITFKKKGIKVNTATDISSIDMSKYELVLLSVGRTPNIEGLGLEKIGVTLEGAGIKVDEYLKTSVDNIYAAGDSTRGIMLAHFASYQGRLAVENMADPLNRKKVNNSCIPNCIFTEPQIASIGLNEELAKSKNIDIKIDRFDFLGSGMARILDETDGFIKIISDKKTDQIIGASIIGPHATELIAILTVAISGALKASQIQDTILAHPTLSESIGEALKREHGI